MKAYFGAGWWIRHYTERELILIKEDYLYRKMTGQDGYVKVAIQPGLSRDELFKEAERKCLENDMKVMQFVARDVLPDIRKYKRDQMRVDPAFETPESVQRIGWKRL